MALRFRSCAQIPDALFRCGQGCLMGHDGFRVADAVPTPPPPPNPLKPGTGACAKAARCFGISKSIVLVEFGSDHCQRRRHHTCTSSFERGSRGCAPNPATGVQLYSRTCQVGKCTGPALLTNSFCTYPSLRFNRILESESQDCKASGFRQF